MVIRNVGTRSKVASDLLPKAFAEKLAGKIQYGAAVVKNRAGCESGASCFRE